MLQRRHNNFRSIEQEVGMCVYSRARLLEARLLELHTCTDLAAVISALEQAMKLKLAPTTFEMGILAMPVLNFLPNLIKRQGGQGFLSKWLQNFYSVLVCFLSAPRRSKA